MCDNGVSRPEKFLYPVFLRHSPLQDPGGRISLLQLVGKHTREGPGPADNSHAQAGAAQALPGPPIQGNILLHLDKNEHEESYHGFVPSALYRAVI